MAENGPFRTPFSTPKIPPKSLCGSLFCVPSQEMIGAKKSTQTFFCTKLFGNPSGHGRPRRRSWTSAPKNAFFCGPDDGEKLFDPKASERKGQECPREIRTEKFMFMLFFLSQEMRHIYFFFLGAKNGGFWVGAKKFMCVFRPLFTQLGALELRLGQGLGGGRVGEGLRRLQLSLFSSPALQTFKVTKVPD